MSTKKTLRRHQAVGAYQRWSPPSFDPPPPEKNIPPPAAAPAAPVAAADSAAPAEAPRPPEPPAAAPAPAIQLPTAEELERIFEQSREEGFGVGKNEGYAAGLSAGQEEGRAEGERLIRERIEQEAGALAQVIKRLDNALNELDQQVGNELIALALEIARKMTFEALEQPATLEHLVKQCLQQLPQNQLTIHLHPDDAKLVRERLGDSLATAGHRIHEDNSLQRGDCMLSGAGAHLDGSAQTRWQRILSDLGQDSDQPLRAAPAAQDGDHEHDQND